MPSRRQRAEEFRAEFRRLFRTDVTPDFLRFRNGQFADERLRVVDFEVKEPRLRRQLALTRESERIFDAAQAVERLGQLGNERGREVELAGKGRFGVRKDEEEAVGVQVDRRGGGQGREPSRGGGTGARLLLERNERAEIVERNVATNRRDFGTEAFAERVGVGAVLRVGGEKRREFRRRRRG